MNRSHKPQSVQSVRDLYRIYDSLRLLPCGTLHVKLLRIPTASMCWCSLLRDVWRCVIKLKLITYKMYLDGSCFSYCILMRKVNYLQKIYIVVSMHSWKDHFYSDFLYWFIYLVYSASTLFSHAHSPPIAPPLPPPLPPPFRHLFLLMYVSLSKCVSSSKLSSSFLSFLFFFSSRYIICIFPRSHFSSLLAAPLSSFLSLVLACACFSLTFVVAPFFACCVSGPFHLASPARRPPIKGKRIHTA